MPRIIRQRGASGKIRRKSLVDYYWNRLTRRMENRYLSEQSRLERDIRSNGPKRQRKPQAIHKQGSPIDRRLSVNKNCRTTPLRDTIDLSVITQLRTGHASLMEIVEATERGRWKVGRYTFYDPAIANAVSWYYGVPVVDTRKK